MLFKNLSIENRKRFLQNFRRRSEIYQVEQKHKNVTRNPNVALAIYDQNNPYDMVSVRGKVVEQVNGDAAEKYIDKLTRNTWGLGFSIGITENMIFRSTNF